MFPGPDDSMYDTIVKMLVTGFLTPTQWRMIQATAAAIVGLLVLDQSYKKSAPCYFFKFLVRSCIYIYIYIQILSHIFMDVTSGNI